jgi:hypothetical protein
MPLEILFYVGIPVVIIYGILSLIVGKVIARTIVLFMIAATFLFYLCTLCGLAWSFLYEPQSYWESISAHINTVPSHLSSDHSLLSYFTLAPYQAFIWITRIALYIAFTHLTIALFITYSMGLITMFGWGSIAFSCSDLADPDQGF